MGVMEEKEVHAYFDRSSRVFLWDLSTVWGIVAGLF